MCLKKTLDPFNVVRVLLKAEFMDNVLVEIEFTDGVIEDYTLTWQVYNSLVDDIRSFI